MEVRQDEMTQETWDEWKVLLVNQECAECGTGLGIYTVPESALMALGCPADHNHSGFRQRTCLTEEMRRGTEIHPVIRDNIEAKMMLGKDLHRAMNLLALRFPDAISDKAGAALFVNDCQRLGLDPLIQPAEAVPIIFKSRKDGKEKKTVSMIVTEDGYLSMAARGCPGEYDGAPATMPLLDYLMREHPQRAYEELQDMAHRTALELCDDPKAYVWVALGQRRGATGAINPVYGYFTQAERKKAETAHLPAASQPGNQARVRAVKRWVRETFPECRQKMMELTANLYRRSEGVKEAQEFIDAEYHVITDTLISPQGKKAAGPPTKTKTAGKQGNTVGEAAERNSEGQTSQGGKSEADEATLFPEEEPGNGKKNPTKSAGRDPATVKNFGDLYTACREDWPHEFNERSDVWEELGFTCQEDIKDLPSVCYATIAAARR